MADLSQWYSEYFGKPALDYTDNQYRIDLSMLPSNEIVDFIKDLQKHLSDKTYQGVTQEQLANDPRIAYFYFFNTLTVDNTEILKSLKNIVGNSHEQ